MSQLYWKIYKHIFLQSMQITIFLGKNSSLSNIMKEHLLKSYFFKFFYKNTRIDCHFNIDNHSINSSSYFYKKWSYFTQTISKKLQQSIYQPQLSIKHYNRMQLFQSLMYFLNQIPEIQKQLQTLLNFSFTSQLEDNIPIQFQHQHIDLNELNMNQKCLPESISKYLQKDSNTLINYSQGKQSIKIILIQLKITNNCSKCQHNAQILNRIDQILQNSRKIQLHLITFSYYSILQKLQTLDLYNLSFRYYMKSFGYQVKKVTEKEDMMRFFMIVFENEIIQKRILQDLFSDKEKIIRDIYGQKNKNFGFDILRKIYQSPYDIYKSINEQQQDQQNIIQSVSTSCSEDEGQLVE